MCKSPDVTLNKHLMPLVGLGAVVLAALLFFATPQPPAFAGTAAAPLSRDPAAPEKPVASASSAKAAVVATPSQWTELSPAQQLALAPLVANWATLSEAQKRKWLVLSKNYPQMSSAEQSKLQSRMAEWVTLSAEQRAQARLNFAQAKTISPTEKQAKWQAYQALSAEEKRKLSVKAPAPLKGAAPAVRPVPPQQLTVVPTSRQSVKPGQKIATATNKIDQKTLLPHPEKKPAALAPAAPAASASEAQPGATLTSLTPNN